MRHFPRCVYLLLCCDDTPFCINVGEDGLDRLVGESSVLVLQLLAIVFVDEFGGVLFHDCCNHCLLGPVFVLVLSVLICDLGPGY